MKFSKNHTAILFINKNKGTYFISKSRNGLELDFPKDIMSHLEIIDRVKLDEFIQKFLEKNKVTPSNLFIVLSDDTAFEKDVTGISYPDLSIETHRFLDIVPFDETISKVYKFQKVQKFIVANKNFCLELSSIFKTAGFIVYAITPVSIILEMFPKLKEKFEPSSLFSKTDALKKYSLFSSLENQEKVYNNSMSPSSNNTRLILLSGVFVVLLIILFIFAYPKFFSKSKPLPVVVPLDTQVVTPTISPEATESASPSAQTTPNSKMMLDK